MTAPFIAGSLFTGIAGMDLAAQWAGFEIGWQVENDPFCIAVLEHHYPDVHRVRDVRDAGKHNLAPVPFIFGGFPCQDISAAGKRAGILAGAQSGLWFEFHRLIGDLRPAVVLLENVPAITSRDGSIVIGGLTALGYDARWGVISASDAGASHLRERWFCVAYAPSVRREQHSTESRGVNTGQTDRRLCELERMGEYLANSARGERYLSRGNGELESIEEGRSGPLSESGVSQSRLGRTTDGLSAWLDGRAVFPAPPGPFQYDWEAPRVASGIQHRRQRLHALGNAVVPQVVYPLMVMCWELLEKMNQ